MKKTIPITLYFILLSLTANTQSFKWVKTFGGADLDAGISIAVDASGNIYTAGLFSETVDFDPGPGTEYLTSNGVVDVFVQKLDSSGNFLWAESLGSGQFDMGNSLCVDASGNLYVIGEFMNTVDFDPGAGTTNLSSNGWSDIFIQKIDASILAVVENNFGHPLQVYPNPSQGEFFVDLGTKHKEINTSLMDLQGRLILSSSFEQSQILDLSIDAPSGVYLLTIESQDKKAVIRLMKK